MEERQTSNDRNELISVQGSELARRSVPFTLVPTKLELVNESPQVSVILEELDEGDESPGTVFGREDADMMEEVIARGPEPAPRDESKIEKGRLVFVEVVYDDVNELWREPRTTSSVRRGDYGESSAGENLRAGHRGYAGRRRHKW